MTLFSMMVSGLGMHGLIGNLLQQAVRSPSIGRACIAGFNLSQ